ncbi:DUF6925 family protein [Methylobacterium sp. P5_C11]
MTGGSGQAAEALLRAQLADPAGALRLGSYGALAVFSRDRDEPARFHEGGRIGIVTDRGAVSLAVGPDLRPFAYETGFTDGWSQGIALCLPASACTMGQRAVLTELGPDDAAVRPQDRAAHLFDLGLGLHAVDACIRAADPGRIDRLRALEGRSLLASGGTGIATVRALGADSVFITRFGRVEVYGPDRRSVAAGAGPRSHVLPHLLRLRRTHAATAPIPEGWVPCGGLDLAHPTRDGSGRPIPFDTGRHAAFGQILEVWGDAALVALRAAVLAGQAPDASLADGRFARSAIRAARAQRKAGAS